MNIPVMDQHQRRPMNKPAQLFDTYHRLYWDNEWEEHWKNPRKSSLEENVDQIINRDLQKELAEESMTYREAQDEILNYCVPDCNLDMLKRDLLDIKQERDEATTKFLKGSEHM
uniref:Uncharacterized protein n=1 Tax=Romanomermis culicivorax TaxID=13658 RepID=A0A915HVW8_ROMCU